MTINLNLKSTSYPSLTIGKNGPTIFQGTSIPSGTSGTSGDLYLYINGSSSSIYQKLGTSWSLSGGGGGISSIIAGNGLSGGTITSSGTLAINVDGSTIGINGSNQLYAVNVGTGNVIGTANNFNGEIVVFNGTTGESIGPSGVEITSNQAIQIIKNNSNVKTSTYTSWGTTSDATQTELFQDGSSARITLNNNTTMIFSIQLIGRGTGTNAGSNYIENISGAISINGSASTTALVSDNETQVMINPNTLSWSSIVDADTTNGALRLRVTGQAATNIVWGATIKTTEVTG